MAQQNNKAGRPRPLSPHLQVYRLPMAAVLSILHRASIVLMYLGTFGLIGILADYAFIEQCACAAWLKETATGQLIVKLVLSGYALVASYWICASIRHFASDFGFGFSLPNVNKINYITIAATLVMAALIICYGIL